MSEFCKLLNNLEELLPAVVEIENTEDNTTSLDLTDDGKEKLKKLKNKFKPYQSSDAKTPMDEFQKNFSRLAIDTIDTFLK